MHFNVTMYMFIDTSNIVYESCRLLLVVHDIKLNSLTDLENDYGVSYTFIPTVTL